MVNYIESYENEYNIYLVMEYYNGGDLASLIQKKARYEHNFSEKESRDITQKVLKTLKYWHSKGVVHGDLKPSDILFDSNNEIKLIDFLNVPDTIINSNTSGNRFASPEIKEGKHPTAKSDIWALGVILHVMLTGRYPIFNNSNTLSSKLSERISKNAWSLLKSMLDPKDNLSAEEWLTHPWMISDLADEEENDGFIDSDFESEISPNKKPQSQPGNLNQGDMLFRFGSERTQKKNNKSEGLDLWVETEDTSSVKFSNRNQDAIEHEERMQKIMEEIFDGEPIPMSSASED